MACDTSLKRDLSQGFRGYSVSNHYLIPRAFFGHGGDSRLAGQFKSGCGGAHRPDVQGEKEHLVTLNGHHQINLLATPMRLQNFYLTFHISHIRMISTFQTRMTMDLWATCPWQSQVNDTSNTQPFLADQSWGEVLLLAQCQGVLTPISYCIGPVARGDLKGSAPMACNESIDVHL